MVIKKIIIVIITSIIIIILSILFYKNKKNNFCYQKCSNYHYLGTSNHWYYENYVIDINDTIWIDKECYNDWCICIDECKPGLCCEFLN